MSVTVSLIILVNLVYKTGITTIDTRRRIDRRYTIIILVGLKYTALIEVTEALMP